MVLSSEVEEKVPAFVGDWALLLVQPDNMEYLEI